jgi:hypothetical protein
VQLRNQLSDRANFLPVGAVERLRIDRNYEPIDSTPNPDDDVVTSLKIQGFSTLAELCTFLEYLPSGINDILDVLDYK